MGTQGVDKNHELWNLYFWQKVEDGLRIVRENISGDRDMTRSSDESDDLEDFAGDYADDDDTDKKDKDEDEEVCDTRMGRGWGRR